MQECHQEYKLGR